MITFVVTIVKRSVCGCFRGTLPTPIFPLMDSPAIDVQDLVKIYNPGKPDEVRALDGLSFRVPRGSIFGLLGPNGAGKSTLLKILTTLLPHSSGRVSVMGHDVRRDPLAVRRNICIVLQQNAVEQFLSVEDNFKTFGRFHGLSAREVAERSERLYDVFGLEAERTQKVIDLSGGFKRRVQVAKVFMIDAPVIFLDEATTGMDPINKRATMDAVASEAKRGRTVVLTTHLLEEAEELCDTILFINKGRAVLEGDLYTIKARAHAIVDVSATFERIDDGLAARIRALPSLRTQIIGSTAVLTVNADAQPPYPLLGSLLALGTALTFEVRGATLEDVFLDVMREETP